jgi:hypothetical protein
MDPNNLQGVRSRVAHLEHKLERLTQAVIDCAEQLRAADTREDAFVSLGDLANKLASDDD